MIQALVLVSLLSVATSWPSIPGILSKPTAELEDCGPEKNSAFKLLLHKISQNDTDHNTYNPNKPADVSIMYANDDRPYNDIQIEFNYWVNGIPMPSQKEDACAHGIICPNPVGEHQVSREIQFPTFPGKTKMEVLWKNQDTILLCLRAMIFVPVMNAFRWR
jgi:hypothetical protein